MSVQPPPPATQTPPAAAPALPDGQIRFFRALTYPFFDMPWHWALNLTLVALLQYVPLVGLFLVQGWSLEVARRVRAGAAKPLPRWNSFSDYFFGFLRCLGVGMLLWLIWIVVYEVPGLILTVVLVVMTAYQLITQAWGWIQTLQSGEPVPAMTNEQAMTMATNWVADFLAQKAIVLAITMLIFAVGHLLFCGGMVRYLNSGSFWSFFQPFRNLAMVVRHFGSFAKVIFFWIVLQWVLWLVGLIMTSFGVSAFFTPLVIPIGFWTLGHLYGQLALKVSEPSSCVP